MHGHLKSIATAAYGSPTTHPSKETLAAVWEGVSATFETIPAMAAAGGFVSGEVVTVASGHNGEPETFQIDTGSTLTANGTTVIALTGVAGRAISTRTSFSLVSDLLADLRTFSDGVSIQAEGFTYTVAATDATDHHVTTAGGVKLYVQQQAGRFNVRAFGAAPYVSAAIPTDAAPGVQAALNAAAQAGSNPAQGDYRGTVFIPNGSYWFGSTVGIPNAVTIEGASYEGTILNHQNAPAAYSIFKNQDDDSMNFVRIRNMRVVGGTYFLSAVCPSNMDNVLIEDVRLDLQTTGAMIVDGEMYYLRWNNVRANSCVSGLRQTGGAANHNTIHDSQFTNLTGTHISLGFSVKQFDVTQTRFEGGGLIDGISIITNQARSINFRGCFFENAHKTLVSDGASFNGYTFDRCTFVYHNSTGTPEEYTFTTSGFMEFGTNWWDLEHAGPNVSYISGNNHGMLGKGKKKWTEITGDSGKMVGETTNLPASATATDIISFTRTVTSSATTNTAHLAGKLSVGIMSVASGGQQCFIQREYSVRVSSVGSGALVVAVEQDNDNDVLFGISAVDVATNGAVAATVANLAITVTGNDDATDQVAKMHWSFEFTKHTSLDAIDVDFSA